MFPWPVRLGGQENFGASVTDQIWGLNLLAFVLKCQNAFLRSSAPLGIDLITLEEGRSTLATDIRHSLAGSQPALLFPLASHMEYQNLVLPQRAGR